ncbi:FAD-binding protein [Edaphobacter paludis]|uniref:L-aspartate oxidase n=1 Tax=Edaphobacter paludis TaxID=3035702 RepID=A0AAU7DBV8_9BACT
MGSTFLCSEAVRGEGAVLVNAAGQRFMQSVHPDAELAPRDVVARGIAVEMAAQGGRAVCLDASVVEAKHGAGFLAHRFPTIDRAVKERGLDWAHEPIPVTPAAHYWMGGVRTDPLGRTSIPGLFAVGGVACTGVHGANLLASNSLLESAVFAWQAAQFWNSNNYDPISKNEEPNHAIRFYEREAVLTTHVDRLALPFPHRVAHRRDFPIASTAWHVRSSTRGGLC